MDRTDRHFRFMVRLISRETLLYTEMVTTGAILFGDRPRHLAFDPLEKPLALQLGGDDPKALAECARIAEQWGYDEVNINVGCPSERVQSGNFGACLMASPDQVARCVEAMREATGLPVTVKHRIGIDDNDSYDFMDAFVSAVESAGADRVTVHARIAWLSGLNPKQNRTVPPLRYGDVFRLKASHPELPVELNGGVQTLDDSLSHLARVDAVMLGRAVWDNPYILAAADRKIFARDVSAASRLDVARAMLEYAEARVSEGHGLNHITKRMLNLFAGCPGARQWRRMLTESAARSDTKPSIIEEALRAVERPITQTSRAQKLPPRTA